MGADNAISFYNFDPESKEAALRLFDRYAYIAEGQPWYAGDHCAFVFAGTPCAAIAASDLFTGGLADTHTPRDTSDRVDTGLIGPTAEHIAAFIRDMTSH